MHVQYGNLSILMSDTKHNKTDVPSTNVNNVNEYFCNITIQY